MSGGDPPRDPPLPVDAPPGPEASTPPAGPDAAPLSELSHLVEPDAGGVLRDAVGAPTAATRSRANRDDEVDELRPRSRGRAYAIGAGVAALAIGIATMAFLGMANSSRYLLACAPDHVTAQQGRGFPPWGTRELTAPEWKAIALLPTAECKPRETDDLHELEGWYLGVLLDQADVTLARKDLLDAAATHSGSAAPINPIDAVAAQLEQASLLARGPDRREQRTQIERLAGDVAYWRAMARLRDGLGALGDAAKQLDDAAARHPRHAADAVGWAHFVRTLGDELRGGPNAAPLTPPPVATGSAVAEPRAPEGSALPVEPPVQEAEPIDAGVPSGGVLL